MPEKTPATTDSNHPRRISQALRPCRVFSWAVFFLALVGVSFQGNSCPARTLLPCLRNIPRNAGLLVVDGGGNILAGQHIHERYVPASTLKILTALAALHYLGPAHRFKTDFYLTPSGNLVMKGYGDPFITSEILQDMAEKLAEKLRSFKDLVLDDTFFTPGISIPGQGLSTNPYDAPPGALCANFNTIFFKKDDQGRILSAEPQTPMIPFAREKILSLKEKSGRYTFSHDTGQAALYTGELLSFFLKKKGVVRKGGIHRGVVKPGARLIYTYYSPFALEDVVKKMFEFSNNFVANQLFLSMGARICGPPATLQKGIRSVLAFAEKELGLKDLTIAEGSGISRKNRISPADMLVVLRRFRPYRALLPRDGPFLYKTGTLRGIRTRSGYIEKGPGDTGYIVLFLKNSLPDTDGLMRCLEGLF